jgi:hypothetical protein
MITFSFVHHKRRANAAPGHSKVSDEAHMPEGAWGLTEPVARQTEFTSGSGKAPESASSTSRSDALRQPRTPRAEAWDSGAASWSARERQDYANDLGDGRSLLAVTDRVNQSKADQDPAEWMPSAASATCRYIADWVTVKTRWGLTADPAEHAAVQEHAARCDGREITVILAR